jgi:feruloyl esterase
MRTLVRLKQFSALGNGNVPSASDEYFRQGRKLILYHGYSDGDITPYRTIQYYRALARRHRGFESLRRNARLFMVPGMAHCEGGAAPNAFGQLWAPLPTGPENDIVAALENWVEKGEAPKSIVAVKFEHDDSKRPVLRTMPICPFPAMAHYKGSGDVNDARHWDCPATDQRLLEMGYAGRKAGSDAALD